MRTVIRGPIRAHTSGLSAPRPDSGRGFVPSSLWPDFLPAWWCRGPHLQTLAGALLRRHRPPAAAIERLELPDGDFMDLAVIRAPEKTPPAPWIILLHGLEGSSRAPLVQSLAAHAALHGWNAV